MASIYAYGIGSTSFSAKIIGLQTTGSDNKPLTYERRCVWNVRESSSNLTVGSEEETISAGSTEGQSFTFSGLSPSTYYIVICTVYRKDTGAYLNSF